MEIKVENNQIYSPIRGKWLIEKPEEEVRQRYVCRLVDSYGYDIKQKGADMEENYLSFGKGWMENFKLVWIDWCKCLICNF